MRSCVVDDAHLANNRDSVVSRSGASVTEDQSFRSADMTQDEVVDYVQ